MTIQPSIIVWTVLCFTALYFILKNLLFRPVLEVMDKRREKIENAARSREESRRAREERQQLALKEEERRAEEQRAMKAKRAEQMRLEGKKMLENAKTERVAQIEAYRKKADAEYEDDMRKTDALVEGAAELFLECLFDN